jgi:DNA-directed RNA polymerase specialized sigma24 family protein/ribosome-associated translation inhibitor RaiA
VKGAIDIEEVRKWLVRPLARLRRQLVRFAPDAVHLRTLVREAEGKPYAEASLSLRLPSNMLAASEEGLDPRGALKEAFRELERLLKKEKERLRRADTWRLSREEFQRELLSRVARQSEESDPAEVRASYLGERLEDIERFVRREVEWLEMNGELVRGEVDPRDVVDAAFVRAFARVGDQPTKQQLLQDASAALRRELARVRESRNLLHIEEDVPEASPQETVSMLPSEILDFYQPDDDLILCDLLAGLARTPEDNEASSELAEALRRAIGAMPASWRQALHLSEIEDLDPLAIAEALEIEKDAVPEILDRARAFLRARLTEAGVVPENSLAGRSELPSS